MNRVLSCSSSLCLCLFGLLMVTPMSGAFITTTFPPTSVSYATSQTRHFSAAASDAELPVEYDESENKRLYFPSLTATRFRHPYDRNLTSLVEQLPGISIAEDLFRRGFPLLEQGIRLDLLSSAIKVSPTQLPELYSILQEACQILDVGSNVLPELYIQSSPQANAYTLAFQGKDTAPVVVVTSALLDRCTLPEIQAIIGHELGHVKCEHSLYLTLGNVVSTPLRGLVLGAGRRIDSILQKWQLSAEYSCDRAAMLVAQDVQVVNSAMVKLVSGTKQYPVDVDAFVAQCVEYEALLKSANPFVRAQVQQQTRTHPLPVRRVAELQKWSQSEEYLELVKMQGIEIKKERAM